MSTERTIEFSPAYTAEDQDAVYRILDFLADDAKRTKTKAWLSSISGEPASNITTLLKGNYPSPPAAKLAKLEDAIAAFGEQGESQSDTAVPFVETSVYKLVVAVCKRARAYRNFGILPGAVGIGKTRALKEVAASTPGAILIEADPDMLPDDLLRDILEALGQTTPNGNIYSASRSILFRTVLAALKGSTAILLVDEADHCKPATLEYLRRIRDKAGVGVVLAGNEGLDAKIFREHGPFSQIGSRAGLRPQVITGILDSDTADLCRAAWGEAATDAVIAAARKATKGSARMLVEGLIPAVRDFGLSKGKPLTASLVKSAAAQALRLSAE